MMKINSIKIISILLTLIVMLTSVPTNVFAIGVIRIDENPVTSTVNGQNNLNANALETSDDNSEFIETTNALAGTVQAYFEHSNWYKYIAENTNMSLKYTVSKDFPQYIDYIQNSQGKSYIENTMDVFVRLTDGHRVYASNSSEHAIVNMYRHGYYYDEVRFEGQNFSNNEIEVLQSSALDIFSQKSKHNISVSKDSYLNPTKITLQVSNADDPYVNFTQSLNLDASVYNYVYITMKSTNISGGTVFVIAGDQTGYTNSQRIGFTVYPDGEYHTYKIDLTKISGYTGTLKGFRLDIDNFEVNDTVEIKEIKFVHGEENKIDDLYLANIFHVYSDKLHYEMQLAVNETLNNIEEIGVKTEIHTANVSKIIVADKNGTHSTLDGVDWDSATYVGFDITDAGVFGLILPIDETTGKLNVTIEGGNYVIIYSRTPSGKKILPGSGSTANGEPGVGNVNDFYMGYRIHTDETHTFDELQLQAYFERNPLTEEQIIINEETSDDATFVGYDGVRGSYMFNVVDNTSKMYENFRNKHFAMNFTIKSDDYKRLTYFVVGTDNTVLECSVVLDENLMMLPVPIEVGKNFFGDKDENIFDRLDIGYGEAILPIIADTDVAREYTVLHLYENWGDFQLKQISYIEYTNAYYHLSTGTVESNCLVPWGWPNSRDIPSFMPDHRGMSGTEWPGSRTHQAAGSHSFFRYSGSSCEELKYQDIDSYGPTYVDYISEYLTGDEKIKTTRRHLEYSDLDENRTYYMFEYEALETVTLSKDTLQFYSVGSNESYNPYKQFGYLDSNNVPQTNTFANLGDKKTGYFVLGTEKPYFSIFDLESVNYANVSLIVDSWSVTVGGVQQDIKLAINCSDGRVSLTLDTNSLTLNKGDKINLNVILLPWGSEESDYSGTNYAPDQNVRDVRENTLLNPVRISALKDCTVTENYFMYKLDSTNGKSAEFSISGGKKNTTEIPYREGYHTVPVRIYGFDTLSVPIVYEKIDGEWVRHDISSADNLDKLGYGAYYDGYNVYYEEDGTYSYSFVIDVTDATERIFKIELDESFTGFERIEGEDPAFLYEKPMNLFLDYQAFAGSLWKGWFGRVSTCYEDDGTGYISLYPHPSKSESVIGDLVLNTENNVTGQYMVLKYRIPTENANNDKMYFQFYLSTQHTGVQDPADFLGLNTQLEVDGEWHVAIVDISSYNKWSFGASEDGQYRVQYVRFDPINGITDPNKEFKDHVDIAYFAFHDDLTEIFEYNADESNITVVTNGNNHQTNAYKTNVIAPTCNSDGSFTYVINCTTCNDTFNTYNVIVPADPANHLSYGGVITKKPTYKTEGSANHTCATCGYKWTEVLPIPEKLHPLGDANADGNINNKDILTIYRYIYNSNLYATKDEYAADTNCDGKITNTDILKIYRYIFNSTLYPLE